MRTNEQPPATTMRPPEGTAPPRTWSWGSWLAAALLLSAHAYFVLDCSVEDFVTYDEIGNLTAGLSYWQTGSYGLYNVNPPLPKLTASLPVLWANPEMRAIKTQDIPGRRPEWDIGERFAQDNAARYRHLVIRARSVGLSWSLLGAFGVYCWAKALWGVSGGLLALALWCFEPNVIAHAHLITADVPATAAGLWAAYLFRGYLLAPSWFGAVVAGLVLGVAESCKFTLLVFYPLWLGLWLFFAIRRKLAGQKRPGLFTALGQPALLFGVSLYVINAGYEFSETGKRLKEFPFVSATLAGGEWVSLGTGAYGNRFEGTWLGELIVPLPEDFVRGIDVQRREFDLYNTRQSYLAGEWKQGGWWYYYLYAAAIKVPLGMWGLLLFALAWPLLRTHPKKGHPKKGTGTSKTRSQSPFSDAGTSKTRSQSPFSDEQSAGLCSWGELLLLWSPALVLFIFVSSQTSLQKHLRYALPAFPFVIVYIGRAGQALIGARIWPKLVVAGSLLWAIASYVSIHPHSLAYFNELAGGPDNGHNHLLGSNIDWGQDLLRLQRWLDEHPEAAPLRLAYFNHISPRIINIDFTLPPGGVTKAAPDKPKTALQYGPQPGYFAVSVRFVRGNQGMAPNGKGGYKLIPFRSLEYFHQFQPIAKAGYSIFIYHITLEEANAVRERYGLPHLPADFGE